MCVCPCLDYGQRVEENTGVPLHYFLPYSFDKGLSLNLKFTFFGEAGSQQVPVILLSLPSRRLGLQVPQDHTTMG